MQLHKLLLPGPLFVILLSGCSLFSNKEDVVKASPLSTVENQSTPSTSRGTSVGDDIGEFYSSLHPTFADDIVYATGRKGTVKALNADDGKEMWSVSLAEKSGWSSRMPVLLSGGVTVSGGHVCTGSGKAQLYALNTSDDTVTWQTRAADEVLSCPMVSGGMALTHTNNSRLQALNETGGTVRWTTNLDMPALSLRGESTPTTAYGAAIIRGNNGHVSAVLMQQGQMAWQQRISTTADLMKTDRLNDVGTTPITVNGMVCALAYNGNLTALGLRNGQIMWKHELGSVNDLIINGNRIYLVDQNDRLLTLAAGGGVTLWTQSDLPHRLLTAPVLCNDSLAVGDSEGYMYWMNPEDSHFVAQQEVDSSGSLTDPVATDGQLLVQAKDDTLYTITRQLPLS